MWGLKGEAAISDAVTELLSKVPPAFAFKAIGVAIGHHGVGRLLWKAGPPIGLAAVTGMDIAHSLLLGLGMIPGTSNDAQSRSAGVAANS